MELIIVIALIILAASYVINTISARRAYVSREFLWLLFGIHYLLTITYLTYTSFSASDSVQYFWRASQAENWFSLFETGTKFISFIAWFYIKSLGLDYYPVMLIFSFFGYMGVVFFYLAAKENIILPKTYLGLTYVELVFLLPNLHFWSSSIGKGSIILFGLGLFAFGLSRFNRRVIYLIFSSYVIFMVRPHIYLAVILSIILALLATTSGIKWYFKVLILLVATVLFFGLTGTVTEFTETDSLNVIDSDLLQHRARELGKAGSGIDIQNYNQVMKLFTFWFRPLFFDGLSFVGLMASIENLICILMFFSLFRYGIVNWNRLNGWFKICFFFFLIGSFLLAQISGNLGIAMRQKTQMMPFFFIVFAKAMTYSEMLPDSNSVRRQRSMA